MTLNNDINHNLTQFCPAVLVPVSTSPDTLCTSGVRRGRCTDLMGSGSWILTINVSAVLVASGLCLQPVRTTVPEVSNIFDMVAYKLNISLCKCLNNSHPLVQLTIVLDQQSVIINCNRYSLVTSRPEQAAACAGLDVTALINCC